MKYPSKQLAQYHVLDYLIIVLHLLVLGCDMHPSVVFLYNVLGEFEALSTLQDLIPPLPAVSLQVPTLG